MISTNGETQTIDRKLAQKLFNNFVRQEYVDDNGCLTEKYYEAKKAGTLKLPDEFKDCNDSVIKIMDTIYDIKGMLPEDARKNNVDIKINAGVLDKKEFLALWNKINIKSIYAVDFDGQELIDKAIQTLNSKLEVSKIYVKITEGSMKSIDSKQVLIEGNAFETKPNKSKIEVISSEGTNIKYDLVGKLVDETGLTRECIVKILTGIEKCVFDQFKQNPEEFILKAANLINEQKATLIVQHIAYTKIDGKDGVYSTDIFTEPTLKGKLGVNAITTTKNIYDHLLYDSTGEKDFAQHLEESQDVVVYVKLPKGFYISTPVGKYNPDWAIAFNKEHVRHIYFIAETIQSKVLAFAFSLASEIERQLISDRTRESLKRVKAEGKHIGRPRGSTYRKLAKKHNKIKELLDKHVSKAEIARLLGCDWNTLHRYIKESYSF